MLNLLSRIRDERDCLRALHDDEAGIMYVEYITLLVGVTLGGLGAVVALGPPLQALYRMTQVVLLFPLP